ncbi:MAG: hypothetical protein JSW34_09800 [Candidatus Zixiibacteriota bacterium]|nr:MAG: hypothetical protein JSW34_09800 [candidate division Zixibacteria bacterium]
MSYTTSEMVRHYLDNPFPVQSRVHDQSMVLSGDDYITFFGGAVEPTSVTVKAPAGGGLARVNVYLSGAITAFSSVPAVNGTVVVASDSSLGTVFVAGVDYAVDYAAATISIKTGGAISVGQTVIVWFLPYTLYQSGSDYLIDHSRGAIKRVATGDLVDGQTVYLDYNPTFVSHREEIVAQAVAEANGAVELAVDPDRQFGADRRLQMAATYRALEIICRASAARELSGLRGDSKAAQVWMTLGEHYHRRSDELLSGFRPPLAGPASPALS